MINIGRDRNEQLAANPLIGSEHAGSSPVVQC
jgi:hypothetical protein